MKIDTLLESARNADLPPLQRKVLDYLEAHGDEVFSYRDVALARALDAKLSAVGFTLWALQQKGLIGKQAVAGKVYFGSKAAIEELRSSLGMPTGDPFERATENLTRIRSIVGNIDVQALLDEVREAS
jgi:hypothetical protein